MSRFIIHQSQVPMHIELEHAHLLKIHEETIPSLLSNLSDQIRRDNLLKNPVIVDSKTLTVLDGSHRFVALKDLLKASFIPICAIDYDSPQVKVEVWYRLACGDSQRTNEVLNYLARNEKLESIDLRQIDDLIKSRKVAFCILSRDGVLAKFMEFNCSIEAYQKLKCIEHLIIQAGLSIQYLSDVRSALQAIFGKQATMLLIPPPISKEDVRAVALKGLLYPPKSTRHIIPSRPLYLNIPLSILYSQSDKEKASSLLMEHLSKGFFERKPPYTKIEDRVYTEDVLVFKRY
ncbi:MAG: hypothetical protein DRJ33_05610 [Candidatus Methanomethylicota archaeon]|uniref:ParB/Sulfiredoxin domain-containing protein n=1 Tax=Thermoproteota archaeon TaxID=2056631 RepID=A0A497EW28_9CREN|nr:MAG: hypothetical protein DRJ33_05610 [Candidatus Verstraetearchaeota archaeon]